MKRDDKRNIFFGREDKIVKVNKKHGQIHRYPNRVRVGKGCIHGHYSLSAGAVSPKAVKTKESRND